MEKSLPKIFRLALNIGGYLVYTFIVSIVFSFLFPVILKLIGKDILNPLDPIFTKIQIVIAIIVLVITLYFRRYCYMTLNDDLAIETTEENIKNVKVHTIKKDIKSEFNFESEDNDSNEDELKIYVDKEIKR